MPPHGSWCPELAGGDTIPHFSLRSAILFAAMPTHPATPCSTPDKSAFLPTTAAEMQARGWDAVDVVFVSGDAYIDHPSFAAALLGRVLEKEGFRVAILPQPAWNDASAFRQFGRPRLCFAVSAGNMDSMINHYTANKKRRNDDAYSPGGKIELRPDRATNVYAQRCREAFKEVPVIAGGVEASLRRIAHFDYWSETVRPSILVTSKADLVGFGMGERVIVDVCKRLAGAGVPACRVLSRQQGGRTSVPRANQRVAVAITLHSNGHIPGSSRVWAAVRVLIESHRRRGEGASRGQRTVGLQIRR